ncbi:TetR/AcrR family transcriptional regulator [Mycobacteroides salmoniphilum]|uniref:TetR/AcrR family transcriptional regulator n=1 Tax=Mycobacteroides salmoniphilum TaxID=404941 RepID=UPI000992F937|nr:TetR/AcrR family transcriptional regulator [Mycobacteroides salmoniphilum]
MAATLPSAAELFATKGAAATSIREIASHAGVNHGLVFRYFGTKDKLLGATLDYLADRTAETLKSGASLADTRLAMDRQLRVAVRAVLDGYPLAKLQTRFPGVDVFLDQIRPGFPDDDTARLAAAHAIVLNIGWRLFGTTLTDIIGLDNLTVERLNDSIETQINRITNRDPH